MCIDILQANKKEAQNIAKIHYSVWTTAYSGIVPDVYLQKMSLESLVNFWKKHIVDLKENNNDIVLIAKDKKHGVIGFASGGPERTHNFPSYQMELYGLYVLNDFQNKGVGTMLLNSFVKLLKQKSPDCTGCLVWVLKNNPYKKFYEKNKAVKLNFKKEISFIDNETSIAIAYGVNLMV